MRSIQKTMAAVTVATCCAIPNSVQGQNIIQIVVDDLGWTDINAFDPRSNNFHETPNINALAADGMLFTDGYASCAVCSPTRASLLTGKYPSKIGIMDWIAHAYGGISATETNAEGDLLNPQGYTTKRDMLIPRNDVYLYHNREVTLPELLNAKGFVTQHIGKWHLGPDSQTGSTTVRSQPQDHGFSGNIAGNHHGQPGTSYFDNDDNGYGTNMPNIDYNASFTPEPGYANAHEYLTDREKNDSLAFIDANKDNKFFLNLWHYAVHQPITAKDEDKAYFQAKGSVENDPKTNATYASMIKTIDQSVGQIVQKLKDHGIYDDTLIIFTSDNGGLNGTTKLAPLRSGKSNPYEGGIRVPFIVRWPGVSTPNSKSSTPIISMDLFSTICDFAGIDLSTEGLNEDGFTLKPLLSNTGTFGRTEPLYWHYPTAQNIAPYSIIRDGAYKLIKWWETGKIELYKLPTNMDQFDKSLWNDTNLNGDLSEATDLVNVEPNKAKELELKLMNWLHETNAELPMLKDSSFANATNQDALTFTGSWSDNYVTGTLNGDVKTSSAANDEFTYTFTGSKVELFTQNSASAGELDIYIDGVKQTRVNLQCNSTNQAVIAFSKELTAGEHTLRGVAVSDAPITIDAVRSSWFATVPENGARSVNVDQPISITFPTTTVIGTGNVVVKKYADDSVVETIAVADFSGTGTVTLSATLTNSLEEGTIISKCQQVRLLNRVPVKILLVQVAKTTGSLSPKLHWLFLSMLGKILPENLVQLNQREQYLMASLSMVIQEIVSPLLSHPIHSLLQSQAITYLHRA